MMTANFLLLLLLLLFIIIVYIYRINNKNIKKNIQEVSFLPIYETRIRKEQDPIDSLIIEFKGQLPNDYIAKLAFQIHLSTLNSKGIVNRILSNIETFQEAPDSKYFLEYLAIGSTDPYCGSEDWQVIGDIPIDYIQPAVSSESRLVVKVNLIDESIKSEFSEDIIIDSHTHHYPVKFKCKGYLEEGDYEFHIRSFIFLTDCTRKTNTRLILVFRCSEINNNYS